MIKENFGQVVIHDECTKSEIYKELKRFGCDDKTAQASVSATNEMSVVMGYPDLTKNCKKGFMILKSTIDGELALITCKGKDREDVATTMCSIMQVITDN